MSAPVTTRSLAGLYLAQGYGKEARDAYASLLVRFPDDEELRRGLQKAQDLVNEAKKANLSLLLNEWAALARQGKGGDSQ